MSSETTEKTVESPLPPETAPGEPILTDHLFYATPQQGSVTVEVVDRFGNVYAEALPG